MTTVGTIVRKLRTQKRLTLEQLADAVPDFDAGNLSRFERGLQGIAEDKLRSIAAVLGTTISEIYAMAEGSQELLLPQKTPRVSPPPGATPPVVEGTQAVFIKEIPIVGTTQAGPDAHWEELGYPPGYGEEVVDMPSYDPNAYALRVRGGSMGDRIREGEAVVCSPNSEPMVGEEVVVKTTDGQVLVKKLAYRRGGEVALDSIGDGFGRIVLRESNILFMHPVIGIVPSSRVKPRY